MQVGRADSQRASCLPYLSLVTGLRSALSGWQTQLTTSCNDDVQQVVETSSTYAHCSIQTALYDFNTAGQFRLIASVAFRAAGWDLWILGHLWLPQLRGLLAWAQWGKPDSSSNLAQKFNVFLDPELFQIYQYTREDFWSSASIFLDFLLNIRVTLASEHCVVSEDWHLTKTWNIERLLLKRLRRVSFWGSTWSWLRSWVGNWKVWSGLSLVCLAWDYEECTSPNSDLLKYHQPEKTGGRAGACAGLSWLWVALLFDNLRETIWQSAHQTSSPLPTLCPTHRACCRCITCQIEGDSKNQGSASSRFAWTWRYFCKGNLSPCCFSYLVRFALTSLTLLLRSSVTCRPDFFKTGALRRTESRSLQQQISSLNAFSHSRRLTWSFRRWQWQVVVRRRQGLYRLSKLGSAQSHASEAASLSADPDIVMSALQH